MRPSWLDIAALHPLCFETALSHATHYSFHVRTSVQPRWMPKLPVFLFPKLCALRLSPLFLHARRYAPGGAGGSFSFTSRIGK